MEDTSKLVRFVHSVRAECNAALIPGCWICTAWTSLIWACVLRIILDCSNHFSGYHAHPQRFPKDSRRMSFEPGKAELDPGA